MTLLYRSSWVSSLSRSRLKYVSAPSTSSAVFSKRNLTCSSDSGSSSGSSSGSLSVSFEDFMKILRTKLKDSMRSKTPVKSDVIRSLMADLQTYTHQKQTPPSSIKILQKAIKRRQEAIEEFQETTSTTRTEEICGKYKNEIEILSEFYKTIFGVEGGGEEGGFIGAEEVEKMVREVMEKGNDDGVNNVNKGFVIKKVKEMGGDLVDGKLVAQVVNRHFNKS